MMEALISSEMSVLTRPAWRNITEDGILYAVGNAHNRHCYAACTLVLPEKVRKLLTLKSK
jgi:hypothetical protein